MTRTRATPPMLNLMSKRAMMIIRLLLMRLREISPIKYPFLIICPFLKSSIPKMRISALHMWARVPL